MHARRRRGERMQNGSYPRVSGVWIEADEHGSGAVGGARLIEHHRARFSRCELLAIAWIGDECQRPRIRVRQRVDVIYLRFGVAAQLAAETDRELPE